MPDIQGNFGPPDLKGSRIFKPGTDHDKRYKAWREQQKLLRAAGLPHFETDFQYACRRKQELESSQNRSVVASTFFFLACTGIIHSQKTSLQQTRSSSVQWEAFSSPQHCSQHRQHSSPQSNATDQNPSSSQPIRETKTSRSQPLR